MIIRAELSEDQDSGADVCTALGITVESRSHRKPVVLALCRKLIAAGHDPQAALEAYRGDMLCLRVRTLAEGAKFTVIDQPGTGKPVFAPFKAFPVNTVLPPAAKGPGPQGR